MNRIQLEHIIRAASQISGDPEIIVIGSQAIHAQTKKLPLIAFRSEEADVYPRNYPQRADLIDAAIGEFRSSTRRTPTTHTASAEKPLFFRRGGSNASSRLAIRIPQMQRGCASTRTISYSRNDTPLAAKEISSSTARSCGMVS